MDPYIKHITPIKQNYQSTGYWNYSIQENVNNMNP